MQIAADVHRLKWILYVVFDRQCNKCCMHKRAGFLKGQDNSSERSIIVTDVAWIVLGFGEGAGEKQRCT